MTSAAWKSRIVGHDVKPAAWFLANPANWRIHPLEQQEALEGIINEVGWVQDVIVNVRSSEMWPDNERGIETLIDGHLRVSLALSKDEQTPVPVTLVDLDPHEEAMVLAMLDPIAALAATDKEQLDALLREVQTNDEHVMAALAQLAADNGLDYGSSSGDGTGTGEDGGADPDRRDELQEKWQVKPGQIWAAGAHRICCGDATNAEHVAAALNGEQARMMWTDPPYGVDYTGKTKDALKIASDTEEGLRPLLDAAFAVANDILEDGSPVYVAHPDGNLSVTFRIAFLSVGWHYHETLIWVKNSMVLGHSDYHFKHEPIIYGWKPGVERFWYGDRTQVTTQEIDRPSRSEEHPTMKPVELVSVCMRNSSKEGDLVYDPFLGSGTTIVAAQQLGRRCAGMELDPKYCAVILERLEALGLVPELIE